MTNDEVKTIAKIVKTEISEALVPVLKKLDEHSAKLDEQSAKLDNHTEALMSIEATLKGYGDMYEVNKDKIEDLDERVTTVEEHLNLTPQK